MKKLSKREKVLLVVLIVIIIGVSYYKFVYEPINSQIDRMNSDREREQTELTTLLPKIKLKNEMQATVDKIKAQGAAERIPVYDNSKELMVALNKVMSAAESYTINFGEADRDGYIFIHKILISFTAGTYKEARQIIQNLTTETFVNQISDINVTTESTTRNIENAKGERVTKVEEKTKVSLTITFFEIAE